MEIIIGLTLCFIAGLIPTAIYGGVVNWLDQHEKEPWWLLGLSFLWGAVPAVGIALIIQLILDIPTTWILPERGLIYQVIGSSLWAPLTEETTKGLGVVMILLVARREVDNILDGLIYGAMAGLGFALIENLLYFGGALAAGGWGAWIIVVLMRTIPFGLNHAFFSGCFGAGLSLIYLSPKLAIRILGPAGGFLAAVLFHGLHNLGVALAGENIWIICLTFLANWGGVLLVGVLIYLIWQEERDWIEEQLSDEVSPETYRLITSWRRWNGLRLEALATGNLTRWRRLGRLRHAAAELAFKKRRLARHGPDDTTAKELAAYRRQVGALETEELKPG